MIEIYLDAGIIRGPSNEGQLVPMSVSACVRYAFGRDEDLPVTLARCQAVLKVVNSISGTLALSTLGNHQSAKIKVTRARCGASRQTQETQRTVLETVLAFRSFSRKASQSLLSLASSTTISLRSSDSLKMMNLYFLLSLRSFQEETHSSLTVALHDTSCC